ncbi:aminoglycoside phosphotransferase family protein [Nocardioides sp. 503]|uniref:phosphotransferase family protein n=1 Tax=Nocardioides sp. 503 TaxID=2508326 RepID=UPI001ADD3924|nr:aminoglycoside phosphotransferase family protein [Nocardioides sp. 503]
MVGLARATGWAERVWGRPVTTATPLRGGWTSTMLRLTAADGEQAVLRLLTRQPWRHHGSALLGRESEVHTLLARTSVPSPRSLGVDPTGELAGHPAHLMTHLPGALELRACTDELLASLAGTLHDIHAVDPGPDRPREYESWASPAKRVVPPWAARPGRWREAFARLDAGPPAYQGRFLHRDFHLGNVLWRDGCVSGVVDWVETSWGPAALDVAHAATYLALLHGGDAAERFTTAYGQDDHEPYWALLDVVGYLPDPTKVATPWRELGIDVGDDLARRRLEDRLERVLSRAG